MPRLTIPTKARLPSSLRLSPDNPLVKKALNRLSRASLISLVLDWLDDGNYPATQPYLAAEGGLYDDDESDDFYPPAASPKHLRELYVDIQGKKGSRREVVDRILEGDWRHGLTLYQLAMADLQYLYDHPSSQRWMAHRILPLKTLRPGLEEDTLEADRKSVAIPRIHPSTFLEHLQAEVLPDAKAHFHFDRPRDFRLIILRILLVDSPYNTSAALSEAKTGGGVSNVDSARTIYIAFPDGAPFLYISKLVAAGPLTGGDSKSLRNLIFDGIRKALSKPRERYTLTATGMTTRNLTALLQYRGPGRTNAAGGGWSIYADEAKADTPLDKTAPKRPLSEVTNGANAIRSDTVLGKRKKSHETDAPLDKRAKVVAQARFGDSAKILDGKGLERFDVLIEDPFPALGPEDAEDPDGQNEQDDGERASNTRSRTSRQSFRREVEALEGNDESVTEPPDDTSWTPSVRLTFQGSHVFAGMRQLVEAGIIDGERMPGWLTGEESVTIGRVRNGRIRGNKGSEI